MDEITWKDFEKVEFRVGTIVKTEAFPEARNPSYKVYADFGKAIGVLKTSAQITRLYSLDELIGKQIIGVVNFPKKQIASFMSEFLITGLVQGDKSVVLAVPDSEVENGLKLL